MFWVFGVVAAAPIGIGVGAAVLYATADTSTVGELDFENKLAIPPLLEPERDEQGRKVFELELQAGRSRLLPGATSETWGANGTYLAPTLRASRDDRVRMRVRNRLPETTTIHWHGMHLPAKADGNPHQPIAVGDSWEPEWTIDQPAATLWYHPHMLGVTEDHVYRGITGLFILDDPHTEELALPRTYGVDDIPVIIQDKKFADDGSLDLSKGMISPTGLLGDTILVNGTHDPYLEVTTERVRLRLLNASNARVYNIGLSNDQSFHLIASDGGLLEAPVRMKRIQLSPAERAEIVVDLRRRERVVLRSYEPDLGTNFWEGRFSGGDDSFDLLQLRASVQLQPSPDLPQQLASIEPLDAEGTTTRRFELSGQGSINGHEMDMNRIDIAAPAGRVELWEVRNQSGTAHSFHPHGVDFQLLVYGDEPPPPELRGWKDTVYVPPNTSVRFLVRLPEYPDPQTPYMFHCHVLQHEDRGMMGQFIVTEPGQDTAQTSAGPHNHDGG